jgi:hypothetical protein
LRFHNVAEWRKFTEPGVGEQHIDATCLLLYDRVEPIEIRRLRNVALQAGDAAADLLHRGIELALPAARDEHPSALLDEPLRRRQTEAATPPGDDRNLSFQCSHLRLLSTRRCVTAAPPLPGRYALLSCEPVLT